MKKHYPAKSAKQYLLKQKLMESLFMNALYVGNCIMKMGK